MCEGRWGHREEEKLSGGWDGGREAAWGAVVGWGGEAGVDFGMPREGQQDSPCGWVGI